MPIEKAFSIIREGAGSHFDPEIVEVFFAAQDEIQKTKEMFDRMESDQNKPDNVEEEVERNRWLMVFRCADIVFWNLTAVILIKFLKNF